MIKAVSLVTHVQGCWVYSVDVSQSSQLNKNVVNVEVRGHFLSLKFIESPTPVTPQNMLWNGKSSSL